MVTLGVLMLAGVLVLVAWSRYPLTGSQAALAAAAVFLLRAGALWSGRYVLQSTGGPLQIPAYFLVMFGWPEITLPGMLGWTRNPDHAMIMATGLLAVTSAALGLVVYLRRSTPAPGREG